MFDGLYQPFMAGWWLTYPSEKYEFVSWNDDIPYMMGSHKIHVPNHQPAVDWFSREFFHRKNMEKTNGFWTDQIVFWGFPVSTNSHHPIL